MSTHAAAMLIRVGVGFPAAVADTIVYMEYIRGLAIKLAIPFFLLTLKSVTRFYEERRCRSFARS